MSLLTQTAFILLLYTLRATAQCLPASAATTQAQCQFNNGNWMSNGYNPTTCNTVIGYLGGTTADIAIMNVASGSVCCNAIPPYAQICSGYRTCSYSIQGRPTPNTYSCNAGDTYLSVPTSISSAKSWQQLVQNYPGTTVDQLYAKNGYTFCADRIFYQGISIPPYLCIGPKTCSASTTQLTTKNTPAVGQCASGDTATTLASTSTCTALTQNGSSIYVRTGTFACCDNIPAGTVVCSTPPPCTKSVATKAAATSGCISGDISIPITTSTTCDAVASQNGITTNDLYTTAGSNICCTSIPVGSTICKPPPPCTQSVATKAAATTGCISGDISIPITTSTTCDAVALQNGITASDLYTTAGSNICCTSIPAGATICKPCTQSVATKAAATSGCISGDISIPITTSTTCDAIASQNSVTTSDLYTTAGSNICCSAIPVGSTICKPKPPPSCSRIIPTRPTVECGSGYMPSLVVQDTTCDELAAQLQVNANDLYAPAGTNICCDSIPASSNICMPYPVCPKVVPGLGPAISGCLPNDIAIPVTATTTCDALAAQNNMNADDLYTNWTTDMCCNDIPVGSTICRPPPSTTTTTTSTPSNLDQYKNWDYVGCFTDSVTARKLPNAMALAGGTAQVTVESCLDACSAAGYEFAGLEWSQECYCGNTIPPEPATDGTCSMVCSGNPLEYCGGGNGLSVYQNTNANLPATIQSHGDWTYSNCYVDSVANRVLPLQVQVPGGNAAMTVGLCLDACHSAGYGFAGVEWSQECYCGAALPTTISTSCDMKCNGNSLEYCGGGDAINVYSYTGTITTTGPSNLATYKGWTYGACYADSVANRVLPVPMGVPGGGDVMTVELCLDACSAAGYAYGGLEFSQECYCGNTAPTTLAVDGTCSMACKGNSQELCGGGNGLSVYSSSATSATVLQSYNSWTYTGCFEDSVAARSMPIVVDTIAGTSMTVEKCLDACNALGHSYAGLEYAQECYCADAAPATQATDGRCNMVCKGNDGEYCGGGNGLNVYSYSYTPVYLSRRA